jgi:GTPase Era involved in 16S rRNA processing
MDRIKTIRNEAESLITKYRDLINSSQVPDRFKHELMNSLVETEKILGEDEIRVAIGGETSSGKTTFLNQFFSTNLFYTTQEEATAVPTEIRRSQSLQIFVFDSNNKVIKTIKPATDVYTATTDLKILEELRREMELFTSVKYNHSGVSRVEVHLPVSSMPEKLILIDTPGFNAHESRAKIATKVIDNSHACFFVIDARNALKKKEMDVIKMTQTQTAKTYFILNKMDQLSEENEFDTDINSDLAVIAYTRSKLKEITKAEDLSLIPVTSKPEGQIANSALKYSKNLCDFRTRFYDDIEINKLSYLGDHVARKSGEIASEIQKSSNELAEIYEKELTKFLEKVPKSVEEVQSDIISFLQQRYDKHYEQLIENLVKTIDGETEHTLTLFVDYLVPKSSKSEIESTIDAKVKRLVDDYLTKIKGGIISELSRFGEGLSSDAWQKIRSLYSAIPNLNKKNNNTLADFEKVFKLQGLSGNFSTNDFDFTFETEIGVGGIGAVIGLAVFGPLGALVGGALGWLFGNNIEELKDQIGTKFYEEIVKVRQNIIEELDRQLSDNINGVLTNIEGQIDSQINAYFIAIEKHRDEMISKIEFEHQKRVEILSTLEDISSIGVKLLNLRKRG